MGLTGDWDGRISRRTLLRAGGSATAAYVLLGRARARARRRSRRRSPSASPRATRRRTASCCGRASRRRLPRGRRGAALRDRDGRGLQADRAPRCDPGAPARGLLGARRDRRPAAGHVVLVPLQLARDVSGTGRTRTTPAPGSTRPLRFAYVSCQNYTNGFYGAYADLATQDVDLVVHLGDYIYEGPGIGAERVRDHEPARELFSLTDYRTRHAQYKRDRNLQAAHAGFPFLMTWDDHEFKDNYADLDLEPDVPLATVEARRAAAYLAYWEHAPLARARKPVGKDMPLYRRAAWGDLATFHVLDTRQYRSNQIEACPPSSSQAGYCPGALLEPAASWARRSATGCSPASPTPAAAGTCSPTRSPSRRSTGTNATARRHSSTAGTATSATASACSTSSRARAQEHRGDHGRRPRARRAQRPAELREPRRGRRWPRSSWARRSPPRGTPGSAPSSARPPATRTSASSTDTGATSRSRLDPAVWTAEFRGLDNVTRTNAVASTGRHLRDRERQARRGARLARAPAGQVARRRAHPLRDPAGGDSSAAPAGMRARPSSRPSGSQTRSPSCRAGRAAARRAASPRSRRG